MGDAESKPFILTPTELADSLAYIEFLFWETLAELEPEEIESVVLGKGEDGWGEGGATEANHGRTAKLMVADMAFCDDVALQCVQAAIVGTPLAVAPTRTHKDKEARIHETAKRPWYEVEQGAKHAREQLVSLVRTLQPEQLDLPCVDGADGLSIRQQLQARVDVVRSHRRYVQQYCGSLERWGRAGLRRLLIEQHENLMNGMAGLTEETMLSVQVCGVWSIRDVYAHVLSWNEYCSLLIRKWPQPDPALLTEWTTLEALGMTVMNERMMERGAHLTMIEIADGLTTEFRRMMRVFDRASDAALNGVGLTWGGPGVLSHFFYEVVMHEAEHAAQIWAFRAGVLDEESAANRSDDS